ncbi:MAG: hypothetical protein JNK55_13620 [Rubrivivax sp.]|nr:hypothetical protein [Rubrivivax sp.]
MSSLQSTFLLRWSALTCVVGVMAGCATAPPATPEQAVRARANERLKALVSADLPKAYGYLSPTSRALVSFENWRNNLTRATVWKSAEVFSVQCPTADRCNVRVTIHHQPLVLGGTLGTITSAIDETWLADKGDWWLLNTQ